MFQVKISLKYLVIWQLWRILYYFKLGFELISWIFHRSRSDSRERKKSRWIFSRCEKSERVLSPSRWFCEEKLDDGFLGSPGSTDHRENIRLEHWDTDRARWSLGYYPFFIVLLFTQLSAISTPPICLLASPLPFIFFLSSKLSSTSRKFLCTIQTNQFCLWKNYFLYERYISLRTFKKKLLARICASITLSKY